MNVDLDPELAATQAAVETAIATHPGEAAAYRAGNAPALGFLFGQVMKLTDGHAHPGTVQALLRAILSPKDEHA